jgi:hypothetical protein
MLRSLVAAAIPRYAATHQRMERVVPSTGSGRDTGRWASMSTLKQMQDDVAARMRRGDTFASVEAEVIDPSGLSDAEKAALWLYAWSFVHWRRQRAEAMAHIDALAGTERPRRVARTRLRLAELPAP